MNEEMMDQSTENVESADVPAAEESGSVQSEQNEQKPEKKYTDADVDRIIAKKIAAERNRMQKLFNEGQQENELEKRERNVLRRELVADAKEALLKDDLPPSLADIMNYNSQEEFEESYRIISGAFREIIHREAKRRFAGSAPKVSTGQMYDPIAEAFAPKARG